MVREDRGGALFLLGTPIGNLEDLSYRAVRILEEADVIACEDTRETLKLLHHLNLRKKLVRYERHTEEEKKEELLDLVEAGLKVVLVSDAGMPGISDPGEILVREAYRRGLAPIVIPGPSAAVAGLVVSGLPAGRFFFQGFLPKGREKDRREVLEEVKDIPATLIFYITPHGAQKDLALIREVLGNREAAIARELTKFYEEVRRGTLEELLSGAMEKPLKGEMVLLVEGGSQVGAEPSLELQEEAYHRLVAEGMSSRDALRAIAQEWKVSKNRLYEYIMGNKEKE